MEWIYKQHPSEIEILVISYFYFSNLFFQKMNHRRATNQIIDVIKSILPYPIAQQLIQHVITLH
mgnify:CR=1 FL=1